MKTIKIWSDNPSEQQLMDIVGVIRDGGLAIIPTDTVYAIVCDALNSKAITSLCRLKGLNPDKNNLSVICSGISMASEYAHIDNYGFSLLKGLTPGAYTLLFKAARTLPKVFKDRKVVGIRIPDNNVARAIAEELGNPLLTTSIQYADENEAREPELIAERYENSGVDMIVDSGEGCTIHTKILDCLDARNPVTLRD